VKYIFYILITASLISVGYFIRPIISPVSQIDTTDAVDTVYVEPEIENPDPSVVGATIDSMLTDTLNKIINGLPAYRDTTIDTIKQYVYYAKSQQPQSLGYWQNGEFVKQGDIKTWFLDKPYNDFVYFWEPVKPKIEKITNTRYIIQKQPNTATLWDNKYVTFSLGVLSAVAFYETARRF